MVTSGYIVFGFLLLFNTTTYCQPFTEFIKTLKSTSDSNAKVSIINEYLSHRTIPITEKNNVYFIYRGQARVVAVPGELNNWNPSRALMEHVEGSNLFFHSDSVPIHGRIEYKLWVDSTWILDPLNTRTARGGFGENSDLRMSKYSPSWEIEHNPYISHGHIDTVWFNSNYLMRKHPVLIYIPSAWKSEKQLPTLYVTDGGEYLSLGQMKSILDNLIAANRIQPVVGVFMDPRTDMNDPSSNMRMKDYAASIPFLDFIEHEVTPYIQVHYNVSPAIKNRVIIGASMGGLISMFAVLTRSHFIEQCAVQSPAIRQADSIVFKVLSGMKTVKTNIYIQTGTINDTEIEARLVSRMLSKKGARLRYEEFPEGHNWTNWSSHIASMLEYFFPRQ